MCSSDLSTTGSGAMGGRVFLPAGTYYVAVGTTSGTGSYALETSVTGSVDCVYTNRTVPGVTIAGVITTSDCSGNAGARQDIYEMTLQGGRTYTFSGTREKPGTVALFTGPAGSAPLREQTVLGLLNADPLYRELTRAAFPEDASGDVTIPKIAMAIATFERTLISANSPYDRYRFGREQNAISDSAKRGVALFFSERFECHHCHGSLNLNDNVVHERTQFLEIAFHNTGLYNIAGTGNYPPFNSGVAEVTGRPEHVGLFRAPTLRNVALTAPYMHDGSIATLEGEFKVKTLSKEQAQHFENERPLAAGETHKTITEDVKELSIAVTALEMKPAT